MSTFTVTLEIADQLREQHIALDALVDTGATYTSVPAGTLAGSGIEQIEVRRFRLADNRLVEYPMGEARLRLDGREFTAPVIFASDDGPVLVGMTTLEIFGLGVDPIEEKLVPVIALGR